VPAQAHAAIGPSIVSSPNSQPKPNPSSTLVVVLQRVALTQRATRMPVCFRQHGKSARFVDVSRACIRICDFPVDQSVAFRQPVASQQSEHELDKLLPRNKLSRFSSISGHTARNLHCFPMILHPDENTDVPDLPDTIIENEDLPRDIVQLAEAVASLPAPHRELLQPPLERLIHNARQRRATLLALQESLGQLRLDIKYLMFDLEATRRERDEYRQQLG